MTEYACGQCGTRRLTASAVVYGWQITCENGHLIFPSPGLVLGLRTNALDDPIPEWLETGP